MAALPPSLVHEGFWIDWTGGAVRGSTITLRSSKANVVLVIITILIAATGPHLWDLIAFLFFSSQISDGRRDGIHHQLQFLLRNVSSPATFAFKGLKAGYYWRRHIGPRWFRLVIPIFLATVCSMGFIIAGIVASSIIRTGGITTLVSPPICGRFEPSLFNGSESNLVPVWPEFTAEFLRQTTEYAHFCYGRNMSVEACQVYPTRTIGYNTSHEECPFSGTCKLENKAALVMDTGLMNSNQMFGINSAPHDQIDLRLKTTCAVIDGDRYQKEVDPSLTYSTYGRDPLPAQRFWGYYLGDTSDSRVNWTWIENSYSSNSSNSFAMWAITYYTQSGPENRAINAWEALPEFKNNASDISLLGYRTSNTLFQEPVDDPLFSAHQEIIQGQMSGDNITFYRSDSLLGVLGCLQQYQFCTTQGSCSSLTALAKALDEASRIPMNGKQSAIIKMFQYIFDPVYLSLGVSSASDISPPVVIATAQQQQQGRLSKLPDNQWELEATGLFEFVLASLQKGITDFATGPLGNADDLHYYPYLKPVTDADALDLCHSQRMTGPSGFSNISVFGMSFTIGVCGLIILVDLLTTPLLRIFARYSDPMSVRMRHWIGDGMLQVQRKAFEGRETSIEWCLLDHEVPVTKHCDVFEGLSASDAKRDPVRQFYFLPNWSKRLLSFPSFARSPPTSRSSSTTLNVSRTEVSTDKLPITECRIDTERSGQADA